MPPRETREQRHADRHRLPVLLGRARRSAAAHQGPGRDADRARPRRLGDRARPTRTGRCRPTSSRPGRAMPVPYNGSVARLAFGPLSTRRVRRWLRDGDFDVLHVHEPTVPSLSLLACWVASGPIVATVHTAMRKSRVLLATQPVLRSALEKIDGRIAVSEAARSTFVEHLGGDAVLIPNGVATRRYRHARAARRLAGRGRRDRLPRPDGRAAQGPGGPAARLRDARARAGPACGCSSAGTGDVDEQREQAARGTARPRRLPRRGVRGGQGPAAALRRRLLLAEHRRRVLRHRHRRGDGGRPADRRVSDIPAFRDVLRERPGGRAVRHRRPRRPGPRSRRGCSTTRPAGPSCRSPRSTRWPTTTGASSPGSVLSVYETVVLGRSTVSLAQ